MELSGEKTRPLFESGARPAMEDITRPVDTSYTVAVVSPLPAWKVTASKAPSAENAKWSSRLCPVRSHVPIENSGSHPERVQTPVSYFSAPGRIEVRTTWSPSEESAST